MKGMLIYVVDEERIRKHKRDTYLLVGGSVLFSMFLGTLFSYWTLNGKMILLHSSNVKFVVVAWTSICAMWLVFLWAGIRVQPFGIYERGIVPPLKPWSKMFSKEYFIPYEKMEKIDTEKWKIVEKNGRKSNLRSWFLFNFVRSGKEADMVENMLKKIAEKINNERVKEIKEAELRG